MRAVITEQDIPVSGELRVAKGAIFTPSARDLAAQRGVKILEVAPDQVSPAAPDKTVVIGADHGGLALKEELKPLLDELHFKIIDVGTADEKPVDYPDIAEKVAAEITAGKATRGIIIDGAGIGSSMAANKIPGIRAALCYDKSSARNSREHNDSNVLTLGGRLLTRTQAEEVLRVWLGTPFAGGRHQGRVDKISKIEQRYSNWTPRN